jgi:S1-C subfamily serine protease
MTIQSLALAAALWAALWGLVPPVHAQVVTETDAMAAVVAAESARIKAIAKASAATVCVFARGGQGGGSGVVISPDGYALSNFHVTQPAGDNMRCGMNDGRIYDAVLVGVDPTGDVALIKLLGRDDFPYAELGDSDALRVGDWVFAAGNPFLLATDLSPSISMGIVSGVHRYQYPSGTILEYADCIQTDAAINPGNSGGPLFNMNAELVGVNGRGSFEKRGRVNVGVGYAISINQIKHFMGYLKSGRIADHASMGATVRTNADGLVVVDQILTGSDAYRRGLRWGDEVTRFAGRPINTVNAFKNALGIYPAGWRVPLSYRREGESFETFVRLTGVHHEGELAEMINARPTSPPEGDPGGPRRGRGGGPPGDEQPGPGRGRRGGPERGGPGRGGPPPDGEEPELSELVRAHLEPRPGFANYHFNRENQARVGSSFARHGDFSTAAVAWRIEGKLAGDGGPFRVELSDGLGTITLPDGEFRTNFADLADAATKPAGSGGLLAALHLWRRLLIGGLGDFGEVYYLGTAPLTWPDGMTDVLVGVHGGLETKFYFTPDDGRLAAVETFGAIDADPCEVLLSDYRAIDGELQFPHRWEIHHGGERYAVLEVETVAFRPAEGGD